MNERGRFIYQDPDGTICISFERGGKGAPIESLVPPSGRGADFGDFKVAAYFDLAYLVLISPEDWTSFGKNMKLKGLTKDNPVKTSPPPPNLDFLKLRLPNGDMDCAGAVDLFAVVAAYWQGGNLWHVQQRQRLMWQAHPS